MNLRFEDFDDPLEDDEYPSEDDYDFEDEEPTYVTCNHCGAEVYEDLEQCPSCGMFISVSTSPWRGRPVWWIVLGAMGLTALILALALV